jgi:glycosyltransferase involved in cell wall biosynthesis
MNSHSVWPHVEPLTDLTNSWSVDETLPKISIVTPNLNYGHLIEATIRSILIQNYPNLEYLILDGGSTDNSLEVIQKYKDQISHIEQDKDLRQYPSINKGFSKASGEIFGWLNSDDIYLPWTLRTVGLIFKHFPEIDWIIGVPSSIQDGVIHHVKELKPFPRELIRSGLFHGGEGGVGWIQQESSFWRRSLWEKAGCLRTDLRYAADFELWTRFAKFTDLYAVSTLLGGFSNRAGANLSQTNRDRYFAEIKQVQQELTADPNSSESKWAKNIGRFGKVKGRLGGKLLARRLYSVKKLKGPILNWHFGESRYQIVQRSFFG